MYFWLVIAWGALGVQIFKGIAWEWEEEHRKRHRHNDDCQDWVQRP